MSGRRTCSYCGRGNDSAEVLCRECGAELSSTARPFRKSFAWRRVWVAVAAITLLGGLCLAIAIPIRDYRWAHQKAARSRCRSTLKVLWLEILLKTDQTNFTVTQAMAEIRSSPQSKFLECPATGRPYEISAANEKWLNKEKFTDQLAIWCRESHAERKYNAIKFEGGGISLTQKLLPPAKSLTE